MDDLAEINDERRNRKIQLKLRGCLGLIDIKGDNQKKTGTKIRENISWKNKFRGRVKLAKHRWKLE